MGLFGFGKKDEKKPEWRFPVGPDTAVYTTSFVLDGKPVTYVSHDADGDWQFFSDDEAPDQMAVAKIVGLGQMIERDPTLVGLATMPRGFGATRSAVGEQWKGFKLDDTDEG